MRKLLLGTILAAGLGLGSAQRASAHWVVETAYRWDPACCRYVLCRSRHWVPERRIRVAAVPAPVIYPAPVRVEVRPRVAVVVPAGPPIYRP